MRDKEAQLIWETLQGAPGPLPVDRNGKEIQVGDIIQGEAPSRNEPTPEFVVVGVSRDPNIEDAISVVPLDVKTQSAKWFSVVDSIGGN